MVASSSIVEVLNTETQQWHTAPDLPEPLAWSSLTLCGNFIYLFKMTNSVYSCSLSSLLLSAAGSKSPGEHPASTPVLSSKDSIWNRIAYVPLVLSTAVTLHGRLLAIGGVDSEGIPSTAVHIYHPTTDSWEVISHITTARVRCLAAVLPNNQLMVVGGLITMDKKCDSVEFGRRVI